MNKLIVIIIFVYNSLFLYGEIHLDKSLPDTIDFGGYRIFFNAPEISIKNSFKGCEYHGCIYIFPLIHENTIKTVTFSFLSMTQWDIENTKDFDDELWNTMDLKLNGSRCFVKDGLYSRIDRFENVMTVFYTNLPYDFMLEANKIINSIHIRIKQEKDTPLQQKKRKSVKFVDSVTD